MLIPQLFIVTIVVSLIFYVMPGNILLVMDLPHFIDDPEEFRVFVETLTEHLYGIHSFK